MIEKNYQSEFTKKDKKDVKKGALLSTSNLPMTVTITVILITQMQIPT